jgi:hypothetical protein
MGVKLSVGLQKKVGLPEFGSLGASCHVEFEIDRGLLEHDLDGFHRKVSDAFVACRQAVHDQLAAANVTSTDLSSAHPGAVTGLNGHSVSSKPNGHAGTKGHSHRPEVGTVTQSQLRAIHAISRRSRMDAAALVRDRFQVDRPEALSIREASSLIDELKRGMVEVQT